MTLNHKVHLSKIAGIALLWACVFSCSSPTSVHKESNESAEATIVAMPAAPRLGSPDSGTTEHSEVTSSTKAPATKTIMKSDSPEKVVSALAGSTLQINGDSSLRKYSSNATQLAIQVKLEPNPKGPEDVVKDKLSVFILDIPIAGMKSGTGLLDEHLREALNSKQYADIRGSVKSYQITGKDADGTYHVTASVELSIAGITRTVPIDAIISIEGDHVRINGEKQLLMTDFKVTPPTLMFGTIKTADAISIRFNFLLGLV